MRPDVARVYLASFISQCGSHLLGLALASWILSKTGSLTKATLVFVFSFLPPLLFSVGIGRFIDRRFSINIFFTSEAIGGLISLLIGLAADANMGIFIFCILLGMRAVLSAISRTVLLKVIKLISHEKDQEKNLKIFNLVFFFATAASGVLASSLLNKSSKFLWIASFDFVTYVIGIGILVVNPIYLDIKRTMLDSHLNETNRNSTSQWWVIGKFIVISQAFFQGAYSVLVIYLPKIVSYEGVNMLGAFQMSASFGIISGFFIVWRKPNSLGLNGCRIDLSRALILFVIGSTTLAILGFSSTPAKSLILFFGLNFIYEWIWLESYSALFKRVPFDHLGSVLFKLNGLAGFLMATNILILALIVDNYGLRIGTVTSSLSLLFFLLAGVGIASVMDWRQRISTAKRQT